MKTAPIRTHTLLNSRAMIDEAKCFQAVRERRWPEGIRCAHCDADRVVKHGRDETPL